MVIQVRQRVSSEVGSTNGLLLVLEFEPCEPIHWLLPDHLPTVTVLLVHRAGR